MVRNMGLCHFQIFALTAGEKVGSEIARAEEMCGGGYVRGGMSYTRQRCYVERRRYRPSDTTGGQN